MKNKLTTCIVGVALFITVVMIFAACTSSRYANASERNRNIATQALNITDEFLDSEVSARDAYNRVDALADIDRDGDRANGSIATDILLLRSALLNSSISDTNENWDTVLERRNRIAEGLGLSAR